MSILNAPHFHNEAAAYAYVEARVWPEGRVCPHCGTVGNSGALKGKSTRIGVYKCYDCRKPFSVKVGTIFESSHVALHLWLQAMHLIASSKKGISSNQLHRVLGVTLKTAWFMSHRIREAMKDTDPTPLGGAGMIVEADETYQGPNKDIFVNGKGWRKQSSWGGMRKVLSLVERGGRARSIKVENLQIATVREVVSKHVDTKSVLATDEANHYRRIGKEFADHLSVNHGEKEYVRGIASTNTIEGFFSIFKRGMKGIYQQCGEQHLQRYLTEFDFRYSNRARLGVDDIERTARIVRGIVGKRLTYRAAGGRH